MIKTVKDLAMAVKLEVHRLTIENLKHIVKAYEGTANKDKLEARRLAQAEIERRSRLCV